MSAISIVTICLNAASVLGKTIESVLSQGYPDLEYIVVDGGSIDGTSEVIETYRPHLARMRIISEPDRGIYDAFNKGLALATGDVVGILNAGDRYAPWALAAVAKAAGERPECGVFYGKLAVVDETLRRWTVYAAGNHQRLPYSMSIPHTASFVRRGLYRKLGFFDDSFAIAGDWDFMLRLYKAKECFCPIDRVLTAFGNAGLSSVPSRRLVKENRRIYFKYLDFTSAARKAIEMELRYYARKLLNICGAYRFYARYRDEKILTSEASGAYTGDDDIWSALAGRDRDLSEPRA